MGAGAERDRLRAAYEATAYWVEAGPQRRFAIRVGARSADVDALLAAAGVETWAFVTAANPRSVRLSAAENARRMGGLGARLGEHGRAFLPGEGVGDEPGWPAEPSVLVLGIDETAAVALAREFDQHALVVGRRGEPARLVWVDSGGPPA